MPWLTLGSLAGLVLAVALAAVLRNRRYAIFVGVLLSIHTLLALTMAPYFARVWPLWAVLQAVVYLHFALLARPAMRPFWYRLLVSLPAAFFTAGTLLSLPWAIATGLGFHPWVPWFPYALALVGLVQSLATREEEIDVALTREHVTGLRRHPHGRHRGDRPLRVVQITDPHLGPFMSVARLRSICQRAVERNPDLVFLTGDFLTMESQGNPQLLADALAPLRAMEGRVFACHGNHDHEAPHTVKRGLDSAGVRLLVDDATEVETEAGLVQIVGMDFAWRDRAARMAEVCARHPRKEGALRVVLLHDPGAFRELPEGEGDLVLSGHTHGGQVGLFSLGLPWTFLSLFSKTFPDHGLWARGPDRLYVHRGTGHYGFPLRIGVPGEESLLRIHRA
jgi:uncharacterized protein